MLTNCLAACAHLAITVSEIERDIGENNGRKAGFFISPLHSTPPLGVSRRNIGTPFGMERLEWCRNPMVKTFRRYVYSFWRDPRTWRTDGQTLHDSKDRAYASHRAVKMFIFGHLAVILVPSVLLCTIFHQNRMIFPWDMAISQFLRTAILNFRVPIMGSLKSPCRTSYSIGRQPLYPVCRQRSTGGYTGSSQSGRCADTSDSIYRWSSYGITYCKRITSYYGCTAGYIREVQYENQYEKD